MNVLVTGSKGFMGKHICIELIKNAEINLFEFDRENSEMELEQFIKNADWIIHLAGEMRPKNNSDYYSVNLGLTELITNIIRKENSNCSIIFASSTQSTLNNDYGISKLEAERVLLKLQAEHGNKVAIFRLTNAFGKWGKPNYNSVVSTFCYNISHNLPITISDREKVVNFIYIDDIVKTFIGIVNGEKSFHTNDYNSIMPEYPVSIGRLADLIYSFKETRVNLSVPSVNDEFEAKLYATYLSFLPEDDFSYKLKANSDKKGGFFAEFIKAPNSGQIGINVAKPGVVKGNHYHHTKSEKYLVIKGECEIKLRKIGTDNILIYKVSDSEFEVVDIPPGYVHSITNIGSCDSITLIWASELYYNSDTDTFFEEV